MRENLTSGSMRGSRGGPLGYYGETTTPSTRKGETRLVAACVGWEITKPVLYSAVVGHRGHQRNQRNQCNQRFRKRTWR